MRHGHALTMSSRWKVFAALFSALGLGTRHVVVAAPEETPFPQHPFRGAQPARSAPERLSARRVATMLSAGLVMTALGVPFILHRARWVEIEAVLLGWWSVWVLVLGIVAYRGVETRDDWTFAVSLPWQRHTHASVPAGPQRKRRLLLEILGAANDLEAVAVAVLVLVVLVLAFAGAWVILEMLVPALFFVAYVALLGALRRIRRYEGSARAIGAAMLWATAYVGPLALTVWLVHVFATT